MLGRPFVGRVPAAQGGNVRPVSKLLSVTIALGLLAVASPAQAAARPVTMTVSVSPAPTPASASASVERGALVTLSGRAYSGRTGNAAPVEVWFRKAGTAAYAKVATTSTASSGTFRRAVRATASGRYKVVYRGSATRKPATRYADLAVHVTQTVRQTVWHRSETAYDCLRGTSCPITSPELTIARGPLTASFTIACTQQMWTATVAFTASPANTPPDGAAMPAAPGWRWLAWHTPVPASFDLAPATTRGHFYLSMTSSRPMFGDGPVTCDFTLTAWQHTTRKLRV